MKKNWLAKLKHKFFFVASDKEKAEALSKAWRLQDENSVILGNLFGFPRTAVEAYGRSGDSWKTGGTLLAEELPEEVRHQDFLAFAEFRLSSERWREELATVRKWADEIKKLAPELYNRKVQEYKSRMNSKSAES